MSYKEQYDFWLKDSYFDEKTKAELQAISIKIWNLVPADYAV